jgi:predicted cupin superfamily sugar epimerase
MRPPLAELLDLAAHPEGGWFRRTWTSPEPAAPADGRDRAAASMILFHLPAGTASAWHRVASDEVWIAQRGHVVLELGGTGPAPRADVRSRLGTDVEAGDRPQVLVAAGTWQRTVPGDTDALVTCVVSPEFDYADFELAAP